MKKLIFLICLFNMAFAAVHFIAVPPPSPIHGAYFFRMPNLQDQVVLRVEIDITPFINKITPTLADMKKISVVACTNKICKRMLPEPGVGFYTNVFSNRNLPMKQLTVIACNKVICYKRTLQDIKALLLKNFSATGCSYGR